MKHIYKLILFTLCVILVGCSERTLEFDRRYPDTSSLDDIRTKKGEELIKGKVGTEFSHLLNGNISPDQIVLSYLINKGELTVTYKYDTNPLQYCWRETIEECNHLTLVNLHQNIKPLESTRYNLTKVVVNPGHRISLDMYNINNKTPLADAVELYILEMDGSLTPYPVSKLDKYNYAFNLPEDNNLYFFIIKAIFETYIGGIAYYPVYFNLR